MTRGFLYFVCVHPLSLLCSHCVASGAVSAPFKLLLVAFWRQSGVSSMISLLSGPQRCRTWNWSLLREMAGGGDERPAVLCRAPPSSPTPTPCLPAQEAPRVPTARMSAVQSLMRTRCRARSRWAVSAVLTGAERAHTGLLSECQGRGEGSVLRGHPAQQRRHVTETGSRRRTFSPGARLPPTASSGPRLRRGASHWGRKRVSEGAAPPPSRGFPPSRPWWPSSGDWTTRSLRHHAHGEEGNRFPRA